LRWGEERRGEEKGETKETNGEKKGTKVEKVKKVDLEEETTIVTTPPQQDFACFNCNKKDHYTMSCSLPLTVETREKLWKYKEEKKNKGREKGGEKREDKRKGPRREREASCLALDVFPKVFLESIPPSSPPNLSQRAPSNIIFKNPLLSFASCNDFEANAIFANSAISTVCAPHTGDSRTKILIFSDQHILREKSDTDTLEFVKIASNASLLPPLSSRINNAKIHGCVPRCGKSNGKNTKFF
jgi:hypothetical protein